VQKYILLLIWQVYISEYFKYLTLPLYLKIKELREEIRRFQEELRSERELRS
jgi:hypothetical protein